MSVASVSSLSAVASPPIAGDAPEDHVGGVPSPLDARLFKLWTARDEAAAAMRDASFAVDRAEARLPAWARSGGALLNWDGTYVGDVVGWPALDPAVADKLTPGRTGRRPIKVRLSPDAVRAEYDDLARRVFPHDRAGVRSRGRLLLAAVEKRIRQQRNEEHKAGVQKLNRLYERAADRFLDIEDKILKLRPFTPNVIAASVLIDLHHECRERECAEIPVNGTLTLAQHVLMGLRQQLDGVIAARVGELLDNPSKPIGQMAFWPDRPVALKAA
jgi:hypothetical protein